MEKDYHLISTCGGKKMTYEEIKKKIEACTDLGIVEEKETGNSKQLRLSNGAIINCFRTGTHNVQGKNQQQVKDILDGKVTAGGRKVFVVYGHDEIARTQLEAMLRRWDLDPIILDQQASGGQTIIEKLEEYSADVGYAIVLAQNVVLELGMFLAKLGRNKVAILLKEDKNFEKPSDIQGLIYIPFQNKVDEVAINLIRELSRQGINIDSGRI